jgi:hypothetical protein
MKELIQKVDNHDSRIERLEVLEGGGGVSLQGTTPGTAQTGNANLTGTILAATMTASGTVQGATVTSTGAVNAATAFNRNGIAMNNVTVLDQVCRVLDDTTSRATGYTNSAVQVTGVTDILAASVTLPATLKAVWFSMFHNYGAAANVRMAVENPDFVAGASYLLQGSTVLAVARVTLAIPVRGVVSLSSLGKAPLRLHRDRQRDQDHHRYLGLRGVRSKRKDYDY